MSTTKINYLEFKAHDLERVKTFYTKAFGWKFTDYGPDYTAFSDSGLEGGFEKTEQSITNGALAVLYHENLEAIKEKLLSLNTTISIDIFSFPGGRRFHFLDTEGNELAIWSDK